MRREEEKMMNCKEFSDLLDAFLDGELTKEQAE